MLRRCLHLLALGCTAVAGFAQTAPATGSATPPVTDNAPAPVTGGDAPAAANGKTTPPPLTRVQGLFDFDLPTLDPPGTVKMIFHPHFGDLLRRDYMRVDAGLRWTFEKRFECRLAAATYFSHGLGESGDGYGISELLFGAKYVFKNWLRPDFEATAWFNAEIPTDRPPLDLTDGHNHFQPGILIQHHVAHRPKLTTFYSLGFDLLTPSSTPGTFQENEPEDDSTEFSAGIIYDLGQIKWTLAGTYTTTAYLGDTTEHFLYVRPSLLWYLPRKYSFNSKTQWIIGLGLRATWGPDGFDFGTSTRVRAELTFRQLMADMRERRKSRAAR
jgi:hypothetical protein